jgi:putative hydrolase of the HAD superfamily
MADIGFLDKVDFVVTSDEAGAQKPYPPIFELALQRAEARPAEAVHVGDQHHSDVVGAQRVGITPVLLDRRGAYDNVNDCAHIRDMQALVDLFQSGYLA